MQERHLNRKLYFNEQEYTTKKYVIPYVEQCCAITSHTSVLEIGCGEGGNLKPFLDMGCKCVGIDLNKSQIENGRCFFADHPNMANLQLIHSDIYDIDIDSFKYQFDIIIMRDVIEHIHDQNRFMHFVKDFLRNDGANRHSGCIFFAFPPWFMPFGGHQQICVSKCSKIPFIHLLPSKLYASALRCAGESKSCIDSLIEIKETGISVERFEHIVKNNGLKVLRKDLFFINPNYEIKFHLKPSKVLPILRSIPYLRDFYTTAGYYLVVLA